ncbi:MAG TPA: IS481 family transposase [Candidatus Acidoferrum sp.]|nr:IS481 family transposase [Candidatus Acidoferrum sp.]
MDIHKNARLTVHGREALAKRGTTPGVTLNSAAAEFKVSARTAAKWVRRYQADGPVGLQDRSSRPRRFYRSTPPTLIEQVETLRRQRWTGCRIARSTGLSPATVSRILQRKGISRMRDLDPAPPPRRYEHACPGDLLHLDIKKLGRFGCVGHRIHGQRRQHLPNGGWEYVHVAIDDHSRIAFSQVAPNEQAASAVAFLESALAWYARLGIRVRRVLTDNGPCYQSRAFRALCQHRGVKHIRTRPYTPRTNGKAERFIQTALREWAYACAYNTSEERAAHLPRWLHDYNWHRPHASLGGAPPISRSGLDRNNVLIHDI